MKFPILKSKFYIDSGIARNIACNLWGGVNCMEKNTRRGFYWFDGYGHAGYIVDPKWFTAEELENIKGYIKPNRLKIVVADHKETDEIWVLGISYHLQGGKRKRTHNYYNYLTNYRMMDYEFFIFEEDCA